MEEIGGDGELRGGARMTVKENWAGDRCMFAGPCSFCSNVPAKGRPARAAPNIQFPPRLVCDRHTEL